LASGNRKQNQLREKVERFSEIFNKITTSNRDSTISTTKDGASEAEGEPDEAGDSNPKHPAPREADQTT